MRAGVLDGLRKMEGSKVMLDKRSFTRRFRFDKRKSLYVGVERECFLCDESGKIVPVAPQVLSCLEKFIPSPSCFVGSDSWESPKDFGYELSACQLESRVGPCRLHRLAQELRSNDKEVQVIERKPTHQALGKTWPWFSRLFIEVGPEDIPLDVYPDPSGRYKRITKKMPREILLAACRVIGTHVHIGMPDHETALRVYNEVIRDTDMLCEKGDGSNGKRLEIYKVMAKNWNPPFYVDWDSFYQAAVRGGFTEDPRRCWTLIRISVHGTIEFRMFGATASIEKVVSWATLCHSLCKKAMG